jgi:hypothetical protein
MRQVFLSVLWISGIAIAMRFFGAPGMLAYFAVSTAVSLYLANKG